VPAFPITSFRAFLRILLYCIILYCRLNVNSLPNWVLAKDKCMGPGCTQAEGTILGTAAKMFPCCGARCAPCRRRGCVAHRPQPLTRLLSPAAGSSRLTPHRRACDCVWGKCKCGVWVDLLDLDDDLKNSHGDRFIHRGCLSIKDCHQNICIAISTSVINAQK
jgi:hypothetical protein